MLDANDNNIIPVQINVKEAPTWTNKFGVGYGKEDKFRTFIEFKKYGFLGSTRRLVLNIKYSALEPYNVNLKWIRPAFLHPRASLTINPFFRKEKEPGYTIGKIGGNITYQRQLATYTDGYINYTLEQDDLHISAITRLQGLNGSDLSVYNKSSITLGIARDNSTPPFSPHRGWFTSGTFTYSGLGFNNDFHYLQLLLEARHYKQISSGWIFASKMKMGAMGPTRKREVTPIEERFYAGGSYSVRGWLRSELGPKSVENILIGGNSLLEGSWELRYPLWKLLSGTIFLDYGNVWSSKLTYELADLFYAFGMGLRIATPIGPIRFDVAKPVFEGSLPIQFHLSVGQAF